MILKPPKLLPEIEEGGKLPKSVFLAGAIDMGHAVDWQSRTAKLFDSAGWTVFNPRRDDWDSSWEQKIDNPDFRGQVEWELNALEMSSRILVNFPVDSKAPISLLEFGLHARSGKMVVCAPDGYEKAGNVHITCLKYGVPIYKELGKAISALILDDL